MEVPDGTMARAIELGDYLAAHARLAFAALGEDDAFAGARRIVDWLEERRPASFKRRDLHRAPEGSFRRVADLESPLVLLEERGYLRRRDVRSERGGRPSPGYVVNLNLYATIDKTDRTRPDGPADPGSVGFVGSVAKGPGVPPAVEVLEL